MNALSALVLTGMKRCLVLSAMALTLLPLHAAHKSNKEMLKLANQGDAVAQRTMGKRLFYGLDGTPVKRKIAIKWFKLAAEQGDAPSLCILGELYETGTNVKKDLSTAKAYYESAAKAGSKKAAKKLTEEQFREAKETKETKEADEANEGDEGDEAPPADAICRGDDGKLPLPVGIHRCSGVCRFADDSKTVVIIEDGRQFGVLEIEEMESETISIARQSARSAVSGISSKNWNAVADFVEKYDFCSDPLKLCYINAAVKWGNDQFAARLRIKDDEIYGIGRDFLSLERVTETVRKNINKLQGPKSIYDARP